MYKLSCLVITACPYLIQRTYMLYCYLKLNILVIYPFYNDKYNISFIPSENSLLNNLNEYYL